MITDRGVLAWARRRGFETKSTATRPATGKTD